MLHGEPRFSRRVFTIFTLTLVVTLLVGGSALYFLQNRLVEDIGNSLAIAAADTVRRLDGQLIERAGDLKAMAMSRVFQGMDRPAMKAYLQALKETDPLYHELAVTDAKGVVVVATNTAHIGQDWSGQKLFQAIHQKSNLQESSIFTMGQHGQGLDLTLATSIQTVTGSFGGAVIAQVAVVSRRQGTPFVSSHFRSFARIREGMYIRV